MSNQNRNAAEEMKFSHLTEKDLTKGKEICELMDGLDEQSKKLVVVYARGLSDMKETVNMQSA